MSDSSNTPSIRRAFDNASHFVLAGVFLAAAGAISPALADDAPMVLGPVKVEDTNGRNNQQHDTHVPGMPTTSVQDTPQAVTVIDSETIRQQATTTLGDALRNVPGITIAIGEGGTLAGDQFKIRGFDAKDDVYLDGLRDFAAYTRDSFDYQEVQVLKGPSGLMFGRGTTGGAINTVSKTPFLEDKIVASAELGNGDHYRGTADINYQLSDTAAARLNLMLTDTGVVDRDITHSTRFGVAPSIALGLGTDTVFTLNYVHQHTSAHQDYGVVVAQPPGSLYAMPVTEYGVPRQNYMGYSLDHDKNDADLITAKLTHTATPWLTLENDSRVAVYSRDFRYTPVDRCDYTAATANCAGLLFDPDPAVRRTALAGTGGGGPYKQNSWGVQDIASATANFDIGTFRNTFILGVDASYQRADRTIFAYTLPTLAQYSYPLGNHSASRSNIGFSLYDPTHTPPPGYAVVLPTPANLASTSASATTVVYSTGDATDLALFATDRFWFTDAVSLIAGVRIDKYNASYKSTTVAGVTTTAKSPSTLVNPRASLVYEPDQNQTYYFSWARSATPQGTSVVGSPNPITTANQALDPEKSETLEVGAKGALFDGALGLSASLFQVIKSNATLSDPLSGDVILQSGQRQRVRGMELSATGEIVEGWSVLAAYTYLDPVITRDLSCGGTPVVCNLNPYTIGRQITFVPKNSVSVWTDYKADDLLKGLSFGGGVVYQSRLYNNYTIAGTAPNPTGLSRIVVIPETVELDAVVAYDIDSLRFQLNVNNLTDRLNYAQSFGNRGTPSAGRSFIFSVSWTQ
ncbi:MAG: TonB-dependent siderophore receptor [Proteobacteria bacterium]|nr:TonB-dependent siderophore receptor [Pseudomonadota bacterium]